MLELLCSETSVAAAPTFPLAGDKLDRAAPARSAATAWGSDSSVEEVLADLTAEISRQRHGTSLDYHRISSGLYEILRDRKCFNSSLV